MSNESQLPFYSKQSDDGTSTLYYLRSGAENITDTEITEAQFNALTDATASVAPEKTSFSEDEIVQMHQAQANESQGTTQVAADPAPIVPQTSPVQGDVFNEGVTTDQATAAQAEPVVEAEVPSTDTPSPVLAEDTNPTPETPDTTGVQTEDGGTTMDLSDHPVVSSELAEPTAVQPAPPESTLDEIRDWAKKEEARIELWLKGLEDKIKGSGTTPETPEPTTEA